MFSIKGQIVNSLGFVNHLVSVAATQLCCCSMKAATDNTSMNRHGCVPITLYLETKFRDFPGGTMVKNPPANAGETGSSPGPGRSHVSRSN